MNKQKNGKNSGHNINDNLSGVNVRQELIHSPPLKKHKPKAENHNNLSDIDSTSSSSIHGYQIPDNFCDKQHCQKDISRFHKSMKMKIYTSKICNESWPLRERKRSSDNYICRRCKQDKKEPKLFSHENNMNPSGVPNSRFKIQDPRFKIRNSRFTLIQDPEFKIHPNSRSGIQDSH